MTTNNTDKTMNVVSLGAIENHECGMPIVQVLVNGTVRGYLSPFRKYCFQVSKTFSGNMDMGASCVIGLRKIAEFTSDIRESSNEDQHGIRRELMMGQAMIALTKFAYRHSAMLDVETLAEKQPDGGGDIRSFMSSSIGPWNISIRHRKNSRTHRHYERELQRKDVLGKNERDPSGSLFFSNTDINYRRRGLYEKINFIFLPNL